MSLKEKIIARCVKDYAGNEPIIDVGSIFLKLLLFESFILDSIRLKEFKVLVEAIGIEQTLLLLDSGILKINCDPLTIGQTGQAGILEKRKKKGILPLGSFSLDLIQMADKKAFISDCLRNIRPRIFVSRKDFKKLKLAIVNKLIVTPSGIGKDALIGIRTDLLGNANLIRKSISLSILSHLNKKIPPDSLSVKVEQIDDNDYRLESNLEKNLMLSKVDAHKILERGILGIGGLNLKIATMKHFDALTGFKEQEVYLFDEKLKFLFNRVFPHEFERRFTSLLSIVDLPNFDGVGTEFTINIEKFLKIRDSQECKEFRSWLINLDQIDEKEIKERILSLRAKVSRLISSKTGTTVKTLVISGIGLIPAPAASFIGLGLDFLSSFIADKFFKKDGVATFIGQQYPSIFMEKQ
ncbi:hypothetical protein DBT_0203 [Dissulfuribacter thermophilus]|uniref:Uncharacterized protein n=1 Tax=Dissulfuribacter thermophilus TaxID=1156395 RepID=A0A1B9F8Z9_9BACT|nr:hypothetical protein [Dissulfuribacter thermophilus]OCC16386.1 hypothetical protein DBT_0203 [Dissulfuribacter thermophilus]